MDGYDPFSEPNVSPEQARAMLDDRRSKIVPAVNAASNLFLKDPNFANYLIGLRGELARAARTGEQFVMDPGKLINLMGEGKAPRLEQPVVVTVTSPLTAGAWVAIIDWFIQAAFEAAYEIKHGNAKPVGGTGIDQRKEKEPRKPQRFG